MITLQTASASVYHPSGRNLEVLDAAVVQQNFYAIQSESVTVDGKMAALEKRMTELEAFTHWVSKHHPHVIHEYVVTEATKEKIGVK